MRKIPYRSSELDEEDRTFLDQIASSLGETLPKPFDYFTNIFKTRVARKGFYAHSEVPFVVLVIEGEIEDEEGEVEPLEAKYEFWFDGDKNMTGYDRLC